MIFELHFENSLIPDDPLEYQEANMNGNYQTKVKQMMLEASSTASS